MEGKGLRNAKCGSHREKMKKRGKRHASAEKKGASGLSPRAPFPETTTSGTQRPLRGRTACPWPQVPWPCITTPTPKMERVASAARPRIYPTLPPSGLRPPGGLSRGFKPLLTWGPQAGRGWGARAPGEGGQRGQGKPPAWRARGAPPPGRIQQAEAQEQGPAIRAGLGARRGLGAAAWGWTWAIYRRQEQKKRGAEMSGSAPTETPPSAQAVPAHAASPAHSGLSVGA
jgi:hypothetical protein